MNEMDIDTIGTPALLLDADKLEKNIAHIVETAKSYGVDYRPHIKTHKSTHIAKLQIEAGAIGITVAKVGEAEVMAEAGISDILIAFPISADEQLKRIQALTEKANITLTVDSIDQANKLDAFFKNKLTLPVWIKVNSGLNRVGVEPKEETLELAQHITSLTALKLEGLLTHAGQAYGAGSQRELEKIAEQEVRSIVDSAELCEENGIPIQHRSVGSTPTFGYYKDTDGLTEIRPGNAVFYDTVQIGLGVATAEQCALSVLASVVSVKKDRIVIDAGSKTLALDKGAHGNDSIAGHGMIKEHPELVIERLSEEHGVIPVTEDHSIKLGEKITIIPNHACPVANLFNQYFVLKDGRITEKWDVSARGQNN